MAFVHYPDGLKFESIFPRSCWHWLGKVSFLATKSWFSNVFFSYENIELLPSRLLDTDEMFDLWAMPTSVWLRKESAGPVYPTPRHQCRYFCSLRNLIILITLLFVSNIAKTAVIDYYYYYVIFIVIILLYDFLCYFYKIFFCYWDTDVSWVMLKTWTPQSTRENTITELETK
jgi:hypothetical protein